MNIRNAREDDAEQLKKLATGLSHLYLTENESILPEWISSSLELQEFTKRLKSNDFNHLVYEIEGRIVGYISIKNKTHIYHLFVSQKYQRKGIARALWESIIKSNSSSKYTVRSSLYAVPVYESFGFIKTAPIDIKGNVKFQEMEIIISCTKSN